MGDAWREIRDAVAPNLEGRCCLRGSTKASIIYPSPREKPGDRIQVLSGAPHSSLQQSQDTSSVLSGAQARMVVLSWCDSAPQDIRRCLGTFLVVTAGEEDATGI